MSAVSSVKKRKAGKMVNVGECSGSYARRVSTKGRKITPSGVRYPCPMCHKLVSCDSSGSFRKHGWKRQHHIGKNDVVSYCAECGDMILGIDYLCEQCRE